MSRPPGLGYLAQDPPARGKGRDGTALVPRAVRPRSRRGRGRGRRAATPRSRRIRRRGTCARSPTRRRRSGTPGGYAAEAEVRRIAAGLGLAADRLDLPIGALSGGERRRVELARILFAGDDLLLLDEPTNHLDVDAKEWLMTFLRTFRGALLVISHDLALLDQAITRILHLDDGELIEYRGTYSQYLVARKEDEARRAKLATRQESEIVRLKSLADVDAPPDAEPGAHREVARHARRAHAARAGARGQGRTHAEGEAARAAARGQGRARGRGSRQGVRSEGRVRGRDLRRRPGRTVARARPQRRGQDDAAAVARRRDGARARRRCGSATRCRWATTRRSTKASRRAGP